VEGLHVVGVLLIKKDKYHFYDNLYVMYRVHVFVFIRIACVATCMISVISKLIYVLLECILVV
jgi:hypothetical protein